MYAGPRVTRLRRDVFRVFDRRHIHAGSSSADEADHLAPRSTGGAEYELANCRPAHGRCNRRRGVARVDALGPESRR